MYRQRLWSGKFCGGCYGHRRTMFKSLVCDMAVCWHEAVPTMLTRSLHRWVLWRSRKTRRTNKLIRSVFDGVDFRHDSAERQPPRVSNWILGAKRRSSGGLRAEYRRSPSRSDYRRRNPRQSIRSAEFLYDSEETADA